MARLDDVVLTSQELTYLDTGARSLAVRARENAARHGRVRVRYIFDGTERVDLELADKCDCLAELARAAG
jgi:hypothetical protein